jgi:hypothetical protein
MFNVCSVFKGEFLGERDGDHGCWEQVSIFYMVMKFAYYQKKTSRGLVTQVSGGTMAILSRAFILISITSLLSACGALNNIYWTQGINDKDGKVFTVDAKQRHLLINPNIFDTPVELKNDVYYVQPKSTSSITRYTKVGPDGKTMIPDYTETVTNYVETGQESAVRWRMCAEAPPDVFAAVNSSIAASGALNAKEKAQFAVGIAEAAGTIERTQTINLLRESMYRTCERWLSGALTKDQFIIQAARDQRSMVAVLAIEQLTGAVKGKSTILGAPSTQASVADADELLKLMTRYSDERSAAEKKLSNLQSVYGTLNKEVDVGGEKKKLCEQPSSPSPELADDFNKCTAQKVLISNAEAEVKETKANEKTLVDTAGKLTSGQFASTGDGEIDAGGLGTSNRVGDAAMVMIADNIERIATAPGVDEALMFCIAKMTTDTRLAADSPIVEVCSEVIGRQAAQDLQRKADVYKIEYDPEADKKAKKQAFDYTSFKLLLADTISKTDPTRLAIRIADFEKATNTKGILTQRCKTIRLCTLYIKTKNNNPFSLKYINSSDSFADALKDWREKESIK